MSEAKQPAKSVGTNSRAGQVWLSVVVIGRNEAERLPALFASLSGGSDAVVEWIFVDSASSDKSAEIAGRLGAKVYRIAESSVYGPGTGRYVGTLEATGRWILYLDGDMVLRPEFLTLIEQLCQVEESSGKISKALPPGTAAITGRTIDQLLDREGRVVGERDYVTLAKQEMGPPHGWGKPARYHGGAVLYRRESVLKAGNWNPSVYQLEEIDLLSRVLALGGELRAVDLPMADHYTPGLSLKEKLQMNFCASFRGKKLFGLGQVVTARFREGGLAGFIRAYPHPFIVSAGLVTGLLLLFFSPLTALLLNLGIALWYALAKKWYYYLVYLGNVLQLLRGLGRYSRHEPVYELLTPAGVTENREEQD